MKQQQSACANTQKALRKPNLAGLIYVSCMCLKQIPVIGLFISLACIVNHVAAQSPDSTRTKEKKYPASDSVVITLDAESNSVIFKNAKVVKQDGTVRIDVKNVNLFLYDVVINEKQNMAVSNIVLNENPVSITTSLNKIDPGSLAIKDVLLKVPAPSANAKEMSKKFATVDSIRFELQLIADKKEETILMLKDTSRDVSQLSDDSAKLAGLNDSMEALYRLRLKTESELNGIIKETDSLADKTNLFMLRFNDYRKSVSGYLEVIPLYNELIILASTPGISFAEYISGRDKALRVHYGEEDAVLVMTKINRMRKDVSDAFNALTQAYNLFTQKELDELKLSPVFDYLLSYNEKLFSTEFTKIRDIVSTLIIGIDQSTYQCTYNTGILKDDADIVSYQVILTPKVSESNVFTPKPITNTFEVRIKNGVKVDYSAGLFFNFLLSDNAYSVLPYGDVNASGEADSSIIRQDSKQEIFLPSVGAMLHLYRRTPRDFKTSFSTGISISQNQAATYYLGGSAIFGRTQRIIVSAGLAGKQVNTAKDSFKPGTILPMRPADVTAVDYLDNSPFKVGCFFGVTFNLTAGSKPEGFTSFLTNQ